MTWTLDSKLQLGAKKTDKNDHANKKPDVLAPICVTLVIYITRAYMGHIWILPIKNPPFV